MKKPTLASLFGALIIAFCVRSSTGALPTYTCKMTKETMKIDGVLSERVWSALDTISMLENVKGGKPLQATKVMATWDSTNLYVAYVTKDNDIKGTITQHDGALYSEEAVELFFDADGDGKNYIELEWNCQNATLDYFFPALGNAVTAWSAAGMKNAVKVHGTANKSSDVDTGMVVEISIPWKALDTGSTIRLPPKKGDQLRINFFRIDQRANVATQDLSAFSPTMSGTFHDPSKFGILSMSTAIQTSAKTPIETKVSSTVEFALSAERLLGSVSALRISYRAPDRSNVQIAICTASGRTVQTLHPCPSDPGANEVIWNGADSWGNRVESGVYYLFLRSHGSAKAHTVQVVR
jgi:hypothetical protein